MNDVKQTNDEIEKSEVPQPKNRNKLLAALLAFSLLIMIGLGAALAWAVWGKAPAPTSPAATGGTSASGPCYAGEDNNLPAGYAWYENAPLGYKFAYPSAWGAVTLNESPMGGTSGHYAQGSFAANEDFMFGGNATDYVVNARGGAPLDNPGYLQANSKFYAVQIWKLNDGGTETLMDDLHLIDDPTVLKDGCNVKAAVTQYPHTDFIGYAYDQARINLQPANKYYGVNFVLKDPTAATRAELDTIIRSFQLIP